MKRATSAAAVAVAACVLCPASASAEVRTREVQYTQGSTPLQGFLAWDDSIQGQRPGVLVVHEWWGLNDFARDQAKRLAQAGYVAFAVDMFGKGKVTTHPEQAQQFVAEATKNPQVAAARFDAALRQLKQAPHVDPERIAAIGFCFGGAVVLSEARSGADLDAVVSFHGAIPPSAPVEKGSVKAKVLILTGGADPMVPREDVQRFANELKAAGADVRVVTYPGARHSFTNPNADKSGVKGLEYDPEAAEKSWKEMLGLFERTLGQP